MHTTTDSSPRDLPALDEVEPSRWRLHVLASPDPILAGAVLELEPGRTVLGRQPSTAERSVAVRDHRMSRDHLALIHRGGGTPLEVHDLDSRNGTFHAGRRVRHAVAGHGAVLRCGATVAMLESDPGRHPEHEAPLAEIPGRSVAARTLRSLVAVAAADTAPVLVVGATGTGKEYVAACLHRQSRRRGALVRFNVAAVPESLFESELFGHARGAFTGAQAARDGRLREAEGGTLVLDEIGELPLHLQAKLLRVLEEGVIRPVGASRDVAVAVRFVAATNADLDALVRAGRFRQDLLARLRMHVLRLPELRERRCDLMDLADAVLPLPADTDGARTPWRTVLDADAVEWLLLRPWRDNLRELKAILVRVGAPARAGRVTVGHLRDVAGDPDPSAVHGPAADRTQPYSTDARPEARRTPWIGRPDAAVLRELLARHQGHIGLVAQELGRDRKQVYRWLEYAGVDAEEVARFRDGA